MQMNTHYFFHFPFNIMYFSCFTRASRHCVPSVSKRLQGKNSDVRDTVFSKGLLLDFSGLLFRVFYEFDHHKCQVENTTRWRKNECRGDGVLKSHKNIRR
jgi:hypothetical protein